jgi:chaperone required for assembly of F1-ATPase
MAWRPPDRFWTRATVGPAPQGWSVRLDAKPLLTPGRTPLAVPSEPLARAIAAEWDAVEGAIRPETLHLTRLANTALDRVAPRRADVVADLSAYGETDLLCYRAEALSELAARQADAWDPWLTWAAETLAAPLRITTGLAPVPQPEASLAALRGAVAGADDFTLAALHELVAVTGSLVLGLAVARRALPAETAWSLSRVDETWQIERWGADEEAEAAAALRRRDLLNAERLIGLIGPAASPDPDDGNPPRRAP